MNVLSVSLFALALQGAILALCLWLTRENRPANRALALLIAALAWYMTPYVIGYAGAYDRWPWLSFAPFDVTLAFGPLFYWHMLALTGARLGLAAGLRHGAPVGLQFLAQALVFPLPLATKNAWNAAVHEPIFTPLFQLATGASLLVYGWLSWRRYQTYRHWLRDTRTDGPAIDPTWLRNGLVAVAAAAALWCGFTLADALDPSRDYFDEYWLFVGLGVLAVYLGVEGWRHAGRAYPPLVITAAAPPPQAPPSERDWAAQGAEWAARADQLALWRDPDVSLASMAKALGVNTTYLSRGLNDGLGVTFHAFVNTRRVAALKALLADPAETRDLLSLAFEVGFNSKASFNRVFAEIAGVTPSAFRRAARLKS